MTDNLRANGTLRVVLVAALALILGLGVRPAEASSTLLDKIQIHYSASGFSDLSVLTQGNNTATGKVTSVIGEKTAEGLLVAEANNGNMLEVQIRSISISPNGQISGVADVIVRDEGGQVIASYSDMSLRGNARFFEIWRRVYDTNDETLALDGKLSRRLLHNMTLIGTGGGAVVILQLRQSETVTDRFGDVVMNGNLTVVAGRNGVGRSSVVVSGLGVGQVDYQIDRDSFAPFVGGILWRGNVQATVGSMPAKSVIPGTVQVLTIWFNERINRAGQYQFLYRAREGRYSYLLIQSGRLLARRSVQGEEVLNGDFGFTGSGVRPDGFVGQLRDTSFIGIAPGATTIITSLRRENTLM